MSSTTCIHIVPALSPQFDEVGEYALNLANFLRRSRGMQSRFLVCDPEWNGPGKFENFTVRRLRFRSEAGIWAALAATRDEPTLVLLHYTGHGYGKLGAPLWLHRGIKSWREEQIGQSADRKQFSTVFHELWAANAKPWEPNFYLRRLQRAIVAGLHNRSKVSITSTRAMQVILDGIQPHKTMWLPAPGGTTAGELSKVERRRNTRLQVAIFGGQESRCTTVTAHANLLRTLDKKNLLGGVMLLGKETAAPNMTACDVNLLAGCVSRDRIDVMSSLRQGDPASPFGGADLYLSHLTGEQACKSSAFIGALATRCPTVLCRGQNSAPLLENEHFIASDDSLPSVSRFEQLATTGQLDRIAESGRKWYERYADWNVIAEKCHAAFL
jgi:hypothetical protein